ncbi:MAG: ATP-grasp domain-containing protein [Roseococcus sp.]|nr:ATP-grasp domain-containing protein [Roseococcus sp.]
MRLLVANRGEIARRIARTARRMGIAVLAVHSAADAGAPHVREADAAAPLPGGYLDIEGVIAAARALGATAVHPGYGFLSERAAFAEAVARAGLVFVGPPARVIAAMGDKAQAKRLAREAGLPCLETAEPTEEAALRLGFPVMVKAAAGGGGRGMRRVETAAALPEALALARREAEQAFGDGRLLLEPCLDGARHVEIQVLADAAGHAIHLGERDCSVQRRHQKLIEEGPALEPATRAAMGEAALRLVRAVGYVGAGTVEFLLAPDGRFVFLEMNTRLQVEHGVTEALTGLDLVEWQLRIARGEPLTLRQEEVSLSGHAIEARLCAEDPAQGFAPQAGPVLAWRPPEGLRVDHALEAGRDIPRDYDTMLAKLIAHAPTRAEARERLAAALERTVLLGVASNRALLAAVLRAPRFAEGPPDTGWLGRAAPSLLAEGEDSALTALGALLLAGIRHDTPPPFAGGPGHVLDLEGPRRVAIAWEGGWRVTLGEAVHRIALAPGLATVDGVTRPLAVAGDGGALHLHWGARDLRLARHVPRRAGESAGDGVLRAPFAAMVARIAVREGDAVRAGETLLVLEAMKVQTPILAPRDGVVDSLPVAGRREVSAGMLLAVLREA